MCGVVQRWQHVEAVRLEVEILESLRGEKHIVHLVNSFEDEQVTLPPHSPPLSPPLLGF